MSYFSYWPYRIEEMVYVFIMISLPDLRYSFYLYQYPLAVVSNQVVFFRLFSMTTFLDDLQLAKMIFDKIYKKTQSDIQLAASFVLFIYDDDHWYTKILWTFVSDSRKINL